VCVCVVCVCVCGVCLCGVCVCVWCVCVGGVCVCGVCMCVCVCGWFCVTYEHLVFVLLPTKLYHVIYINNCPTRCNTKQSIYYSASSL